MGPSDEVWDRWIKKIDLARKAVERAGKPYKARKSELSNIYKAAKAEGVDTDAIKEALDLHEEDHLEVAQRYTATGKVLRLIESPLGITMDLFPSNELPIATKAALEGLAAGKAGRSIDENPHTPGSEPFVAYRQAWNRGQDLTRETLRDDA